MFSIRHTFRKAIIAISLFSLTTTIPAGCSDKNAVSGEAVTATSNTSHKSEEATAESESNTFSIKYKYWYDNQDVQEAQEQTFKDNNPGGDDNGTTFLDLAGLPIYTDASGNEYIISGRSIVYLHNGKISSTESILLRDESGNKVYAVEKGLEAVEDKIVVPEGQYTTIEDRQLNNVVPDLTADLPIHINNMTTDLTTRDGKVSLVEIFQACPSIGSLDMSKSGTDSQIVAKLYTAAGLVDVTFTYDVDTVKVTYSTGLKGTELKVDEDYSLSDASILLTPERIECILGYDVEPYDTYINIVTDNHDLFSSTNVVDEYDMDKATDKSVITSTDDLDPKNPIPESKPMTDDEKAQTPSKPETKPATKKSSDGKYDMTDADIENKDGTYTQEKGKVFEGPNCIADRFYDGYLGSSDTTNPSKIPYSQLTVDNAAEAFPYLGWTGEEPDYIEVLPGDSKQIIENKICANYLGSTPRSFFYNDYINDPQNMETPEHFYKSKAEYDKVVSDYLAEQQRLKEAQEQSERNKNDPNYRIGDDLSEDDVENLWNMLKS